MDDPSMIQAYGHTDPRFCLHRDVKHMANLMRRCDLAVSAGGGTLYELCACGVPAISLIVADNQQKQAMELDRLGIIPCAGTWQEGPEVCCAKIHRSMDNLCSQEIRHRLAHEMRSQVDGYGSDRIAEAIHCAISQRHAR